MPRSVLTVSLALLVSAFSACGFAQVRPSETGTITVAEGIDLYFERYGTNPPTVFVPNHAELWIAFTPLLEQHDVVMWDPRGFGRSSRPDDLSNYSLDHEIADAEAIRRHFGVERVSYIGISLWSNVGMHYAARHPGSVARVVMLGPLPILAHQFDEVGNPPVHDTAEIEAVLAQMEADGVPDSDPDAYCAQQVLAFFNDSHYDMANMAPLFAADPCQHPNMHLDKLIEVAFFGTIASFGDWDWHEDAATVDTPVLLLFGDHEAWSIEGVRAYTTVLPNVGWAEVERAGHHLFNDRPDFGYPAISAFLRGDWPVGITVDTR